MKKTMLTVVMVLIVGIASGSCASAEIGKPYHVDAVKVEKPKKQMKCKHCVAFRKSKAAKRRTAKQ